MKLTNKEIVLGQLEKIELYQQHIRNVEDAARDVRDRGRTSVEYGNLMALLVDAELAAWRNVAMWGLTLEDAERDRIKAAVHSRFLHDGVSVQSWMNNGTSPSSWLKADEDAFRGMAKTAFAPKGV